MQYDEVMIRYGELSTKGKNKRIFISQLAQNVKFALSDFEELKVHGERDRMHLELNGADSDAVLERLRSIFGIHTYSPVSRLARDIELVNKVAVEIRKEGFFLSSKTILGAGGLPVGSSGKGMLMLSGGIDSPVAGYLTMKRGVTVEAVHFHSPPYTSPRALQKAKDLAAKLAAFSGSVQFIEVPFTEIQEEIKKIVPEGYLMTVTRRLMMRLTDRIREERKGLAIINGESLGQVASQTLHSMIAINDVTATPIIRPVVSMDKNEIIEIAQKIDTFELSIQPFEDCCTIFAPPAPKTQPKLEKAREYESRLDVEGLIERAMNGLVITKITVGDTLEAQQKADFSSLL